ncbi:MAG: hypothetical protein JOY71_15015 [Acetobacteraceae bacterium]|nr:hypothetical protein [Acetobacteraceae bacterium]
MSVRRDLDGLRLQTPGDPAVYMIDQGTKRHVADPQTYTALFRDWNSIVQDADTNEIDTGPEIAAGTALVQGFGDAHVYLVDQGTKRWIESPATMDRYDFDWNKIFRVPMGAIQAMPDGPGIVWPE